MKIACEVSPETIRQLIYEHICRKLGDHAAPQPESLKILVRSKQNYREHQWEDGELSVKFEGDV
jgi:hypothetical protein